MPLLSSFVPHDVLLALNRRVLGLPVDHPLRAECMEGNVILGRIDTAEGAVAVFQSAKGIYFERLNAGAASLDHELLKIVGLPRAYHCTAFEVDHDDPSVVQKLLDRFQEQHGAKLAQQIEHCVVPFESKQLMLVKLPPTVLRHMLAPSGGVLKTRFSGSLDALRRLPTLVRFGVLTDAFETDGRVTSMVATQYSEAHYDTVQKIHWDLVREVLAVPHSGITLGTPLAQWDA
jgi:hypothetical protein